MTTVRATCPHCGDIEITEKIVTVSSRYYRFTCPHCDGHVVKYAHPRTVTLLANHGCAVEPDMDEDDIVDFRHNLDDRDAVWAELEATT
jgi:predicted RNA-binding Zn-ribbon protein involved in translation (DUF1610 family)